MCYRWNGRRISFERSEWHIPATKNGESQIVTLHEEPIAILQRRKTEFNSPFVFPGEGKTGHLVEPKKGWKRILNSSGIKNLKMHDLRRTLGSWQAKTRSVPWLLLVNPLITNLCSLQPSMHD